MIQFHILELFWSWKSEWLKKNDQRTKYSDQIQDNKVWSNENPGSNNRTLITTCLLLGSIDYHKQAKDISSGYYWNNSQFLDHVQRFKPDPGVNLQESFLTYSGIGM